MKSSETNLFAHQTLIPIIPKTTPPNKPPRRPLISTNGEPRYAAGRPSVRGNQTEILA